ncbi:MAG: type VI secretion system tip protein VgrG [Pirellulales bacterium]|nr:type VI secretion system tip protein VgrG [Pirellulales bacterium]
MALKQAKRLLTLKTPLGEDALELTAFTGREEMSRLFRFELTMISDKNSITADQIVGKNVTFGVKLPDDSPRHFNGFVSRFQAGDEDRQGRRNYRAEVVPWLWFLTLTADCRIFQNMSVKEIIEKIFQDLGFSDYQTSQIKGNHPKREYCVQYHETDFNFVSRLMEEEGIFYYFKHEDGKNILVMADQKGAYADCKENEVDYPRDVGSRDVKDHLTHWEHRYEFQSGKWAQTDYNFIEQPARFEKTPSNLLMSKQTTKVNLANIQKYEIYDYPGGYEKKDQGDALTKIRMEETEAAHDMVEAASKCRTFTVGGKFKVNKHRSSAEEGKTYVITSIEHSATEPGSYETGDLFGEDYFNSFTCIPDSVTFRPARITPKPTIVGSQTAVVVGPAGEEIYTDKYGRVKVQFYWDREGKRDDKTTCFIRCAQSSAGKGWGTMFIPRIGQEVVVSYLEGNPDQPLITGVVYNAEQMPPYTLPDEKTKSYIKTNSSKGGEGYNELRFEDKKGSEQIFVHGQKDMDVRVINDSRENIGHDRHRTIGGEKDGQKVGMQFEEVFVDKYLKVHRNRVEQIGGEMLLRVGGIDGDGNQEITVEGVKKELIGKESNLHVKADLKEKIDGGQSLTVGGDLQQKVGMNYALEAGMAVHVKAGMTLVIEAGAQLSLKVGGNFIDINPAGVFIQGTMVMINSGGAPGSGAGANPAAPSDPAEVSPPAPDPADDSKTGQKSTPF